MIALLIGQITNQWGVYLAFSVFPIILSKAKEYRLVEIGGFQIYLKMMGLFETTLPIIQSDSDINLKPHLNLNQYKVLVREQLD